MSFEEAIVNVPDYLRGDPAFGGGVARQYSCLGSGFREMTMVTSGVFMSTRTGLGRASAGLIFCTLATSGAAMDAKRAGDAS